MSGVPVPGIHSPINPFIQPANRSPSTGCLRLAGAAGRPYNLAMRHSAPRALVLLLGGVIAALLAARLAASVWLRRGDPVEIHQSVLGFLWAEFAIAAAILVICGAVILRFFRKDRDRAREHSRLEHLAQVGVLSSGLAHEIRNYTNAMQAYLGLLRKSAGCDPEKSLRHIEKLEETAVGLENFLNEFLTFARPARDHLEEADPGALVDEVLEFAALDLEQAGVEVVRETAPLLPPVYVDKAKFKRAVLNLLVNARQAMPEGGRLFLRIGKAGERVWIEVEDTGCGIRPEDQKHIFETFYSTKPDGTGLGLAIVRRTIEDLGGTISFRSESGRGTAFRIALPLAERYQASLQRVAGGDGELYAASGTGDER